MLRWSSLLPLLFLVVTVNTVADIAAPPIVNARAWLLIDHHSGRRLASRNSSLRFAPTHFTKLMVAYVTFNALEEGDISTDTSILISQKATRTTGPRMFASASSHVPVQELLKAIIVGRANDAAIALAEHIGSDEQAFVSIMNNEAQRLGLQNTRFRDATGSKRKRQHTNADDLAILATSIIRDHPRYYQWFSSRDFSHNGITLYNRNALLWRDKTVDGLMAVHNGRNGYHLIVSGKRDSMRLSAIVLGASNERAMITAGSELLKYGFEQFETRKLYAANEGAVNVRVWLGDTEILPVGLTKDLYITLPRGEFDSLQAMLKITGSPFAPIDRGHFMGTLSLTLQGQTIGEHDLVSLGKVAKGGFLSRLLDRAEMWLRDIPDNTRPTQAK